MLFLCVQIYSGIGIPGRESSCISFQGQLMGGYDIMPEWRAEYLLDLLETRVDPLGTLCA